MTKALITFSIAVALLAHAEAFADVVPEAQELQTQDMQTQAIGTCDGHDCIGVYIQRLYIVRTSSSVFIDTTADEAGLDNCTAGGYIALDMGTARAKDIYALLLSAFMADKMVRIRTVDGSNPCHVLYVTIDRP